MLRSMLAEVLWKHFHSRGSHGCGGRLRRERRGRGGGRLREARGRERVARGGLGRRGGCHEVPYRSLRLELLRRRRRREGVGRRRVVGLMLLRRRRHGRRRLGRRQSPAVLGRGRRGGGRHGPLVRLRRGGDQLVAGWSRRGVSEEHGISTSTQNLPFMSKQTHPASKSPMKSMRRSVASAEIFGAELPFPSSSFLLASVSSDALMASRRYASS